MSELQRGIVPPSKEILDHHINQHRRIMGCHMNIPAAHYPCRCGHIGYYIVCTECDNILFVVIHEDDPCPIMLRLIELPPPEPGTIEPC